MFHSFPNPLRCLKGWICIKSTDYLGENNHILQHSACLPADMWHIPSTWLSSFLTPSGRSLVAGTALINLILPCIVCFLFLFPGECLSHHTDRSSWRSECFSFNIFASNRFFLPNSFPKSDCFCRDSGEHLPITTCHKASFDWVRLPGRR